MKQKLEKIVMTHLEYKYANETTKSFYELATTINALIDHVEALEKEVKFLKQFKDNFFHKAVKEASKPLQDCEGNTIEDYKKLTKVVKEGFEKFCECKNPIISENPTFTHNKWCERCHNWMNLLKQDPTIQEIDYEKLEDKIAAYLFSKFEPLGTSKDFALRYAVKIASFIKKTKPEFDPTIQEKRECEHDWHIEYREYPNASPTILAICTKCLEERYL